MTDTYVSGVPNKLQLRVGQEVAVPLQSAAGAGYVWQVTALSGDRDAATVQIEFGEPPRQREPPSNAPSPVSLRALGRRPGTARWRIRLVRPWKADQPLAEHDIDVIVTR